MPTPVVLRWLQSLADATALAIEHLLAQNELVEQRRRAETFLKHYAQDSSDAARPQVKMCFMTNKLELAGEWLSLEAFLDKRFGLAISHGLSPEALHRLDGQSESARLLAELSSIMAR